MTDFLSMTVQQIEGLPEGKAQEVLEAWVKAKKAELPHALAQSSSKPHVKLAKKALYRLQSSGVEVPVEAPKGAPIDLSVKKSEFPGVLSMQLGTGERAFLFATPLRAGGLEVCSGIVSDEFGVAQLRTEQSNRSRYRKRLEQVQRDQAMARIMLVPIERIRLELGRAMTLNERSGGTPLNDYIGGALSRAEVTSQDPDVAIPPLEPGDAEGRESGAALHQLFEVEQWLPSEKDLVTLTARVDAIRKGPLPLTDEQKDRKVDALARELAGEVFTPALRLLYARRLWYTAEVLDFQKRTADAAAVRAEARRLAHEATLSPFAEQLFVKAVAKK